MFGDMMHAALERYYKEDRNLELATDTLHTEWTKHDEVLREMYGSLYATPDVQEYWYGEYQKAANILHYYDQYDKAHPFFEKVLDMSIEERSFVEILDPLGKPTDGLLSGRIDMVVEREDGVWIVDHKTLSSAPSDSALDIDDQITAYCYIYWRMTGVVPRGGMYNVLLKDPPKPPRVLKNGTVSKDKSQRTTYDLYVQALEEHGQDPADYTEILEYLKDKGWSQFFIRMQSERNMEQLAQFEKHLFHEYADMDEALQYTDQLYPNPSQYTCPRCQYLPICKAMEEGSDPEWVIEHGYEVLEPRHTIPEEFTNAS
jgi:tetratricopeptide (TPR) repeat protein